LTIIALRATVCLLYSLRSVTDVVSLVSCHRPSITVVVPQKWLCFSVTMTVFGHNVLFWLIVPQKQPDFSVTIDVKHRRPQESFDETKNGLIET